MTAHPALLEVHRLGGARMAEVLFLDLAGIDPDLHAQITAEAVDTALAGMADAVATLNRRAGITDPQEGEAMVQAALFGFGARWDALCGTGWQGGAA